MAVHIKHKAVINSTPGIVYEAVTTNKGIQGWWTRDTEITSEVGSIAIFDFGDRYHNEMKIIDLQPSKRVAWKCLIGDSEWVGTTITFDLEEDNGRTVLRFGHNAWKEITDFYANCNFQWARYLVSLRDYCETGTGNPFSPGT